MAVFLLVQACTGSPDTTMQDTIRVKANDTFEIKLGAAPETGFRWMTADLAYQLLLRLDATYTTQTRYIDGEPQTQVFQFRGLRKGEARLHFEYRRTWQKKDPPRKERIFTIIVE